MKNPIKIQLTLLMFIILNLSFAQNEIKGYNVGDIAMDFSLPSIDGKNVSLSSIKDAKGIILVFTCNTCPYANMYENRIIDLHNKYASKGFPVVAINPNDISQKPGDSMKEMKKIAKNKNYPFVYLRDDDQKITKTYGATKTPDIYLLKKNENNSFRVAYIGAIDDNPRDEKEVNEKYVENAIESLLKGKEPQITSKKAIGCTIKWLE